MSVEIANYATILIELVKAVKMHNFYPQGHPQLDSALERCFARLKAAVDVQGEIKWKLDLKGFYDGKLPIAAGNPECANLAKKLFFRRIKELTFTQRVSVKDLRSLLTLIKAEPEDIQANGGLEAFLAILDIEGILLNELRYEDLKKLKKELEEKRINEEKVLADKKAEAPPGEAAKASEEDKQQKEEPKADEEPFEKLVERIRNEIDELKYNDLAVRIREKLEPLLIERQLEQVFPVALLFYEHSLSSSGRSEAVRTVAAEKLKGLLTQELIGYLAGRVGSKEEPFRGAIQSILHYAGAKAAEALLDLITTAPEAIVRRHLFNALLLFGNSLRPLAEARLSHPQWFVTRQMVALLGEIGGADAIPSLEEAFSNPEPRVKREILKSLVKIGTQRSTEFILGALNLPDQSLVQQAIISLGMLKDPAAIEPLAEIAVKREAHPDALDTRKEAIKALGIIGDARAVEHLSRVLQKKVWFGKRTNEEVRSLAAYSLGMIGTPEAVKAVEAAFADSSGELRAACKRALDGKERTT